MATANDRMIFGHERNVGAANNSADNTNQSNNRFLDNINNLGQAGNNTHQLFETSSPNRILMISNSPVVKQEAKPFEIKSEYPDQSPVKIKSEKLGMYSPTKNHSLNNPFVSPGQSTSIKTEKKLDFLNLFSRTGNITAANVKKELFGQPRTICKPVRRRRHAIDSNAAIKYSRNKHSAAANCTLVSGTITASADPFSPKKKLIQTKITFFTTSPTESGGFLSPNKILFDDHTYSKSQWTGNPKPWYEYSGGQLKETSTKTKWGTQSRKRSRRSSGVASASKRRRKSNVSEVELLKKYAHLNLKACSIVLDRIDGPTSNMNKPASIGMSPPVIGGRMNALDKAINEPRFQPFVLLAGKCF